MARTKASSGPGAFRKVLAGRAPRKVLGSGRLNAARSPPPPPQPGRHIRGNPVCVRPIPDWQRGIGEFLRPQQKEIRDPGGEAAGSSGQDRPGKKRARLLPPDPAEDDCRVKKGKRDLSW